MRNDVQTREDAWNGDTAAMQELWREGTRHNHERLRYYAVYCFLRQAFKNTRYPQDDYPLEPSPQHMSYAFCVPEGFFFAVGLCIWADSCVRTNYFRARNQGHPWERWERLEAPHVLSYENPKRRNNCSYDGSANEALFLLKLDILAVHADGSLFPGPQFPEPNWEWQTPG